MKKILAMVLTVAMLATLMTAPVTTSAAELPANKSP